MAIKLSIKALHATRMWVSGIRCHSRRSADFNDSTLSYFFVETLASKMDHTEKSIGFQSGEYGGHCSEEMNCGTWFCKNCCVKRAFRDSAASCWYVQWLSPNCRRAQGISVSFNTCCCYICSGRQKQAERDHLQLQQPKPSQKQALAYAKQFGCPNSRWTCPSTTHDHFVCLRIVEQ